MATSHVSSARQPLLDKLSRQQQDQFRIARRAALVGIAASTCLSGAKLFVGWKAHSTAVQADGLENLGDVLSTVIVLVGLIVAARPPDANHPYGHGRSETVAGLVVGLLLGVAGGAICLESWSRAGQAHGAAPALFALWPLIASVFVKGGLAWGKFHYGRQAGSTALQADAWHDASEIFSGLVALTAVGLAIADPVHFAAADAWGGVAVGLFIIGTSIHIVHGATFELIDTMPERERIDRLREAAAMVPGVAGIEKAYARKTGLGYHAELHVEVDPELTVREAHTIASQVRLLLREQLSWVADVLVHIEPAAAGETKPEREK